ncbi:MAG: UDP-N-acetylglucosamine--N-acetylmuramyl-(pentapeptide) pyrophosphoryl-undecaprenol N-acetylglucosamine transferase [bacterium]
MKIAIACGGTGGHIYPGIAIAEGIKEFKPFFITGKKGMACQIIKKSGFRVYVIPISFWKRRLFSLNTLGVIFSNIFCIIASFFILIKERPKAIIGMGGYPSFPPILAGFFLRIKRIIHEQNAKMGLANRLLSKIATSVAISYENTEFAPKNAIFTGCPIRREIGKIGRDDGFSFFGLKDKKTILVMGGSQGSSRINEVFFEAIPNLSEFQILWITGEKDYPTIKSRIQNPESRIFPFIFEMEYVYACANIIIGRAGAVSIAEIKRCGIPAILIPYPFSSDQHQLKNAEVLKDTIVIKEENLSKDSLLDAIFKIKDKEKFPIEVESTERFLELLYTEIKFVFKY